MKTTLHLEKVILEQAKAEALRRGESLTALIERALRLLLTNSPRTLRRKRVTLPVCRAGGGLRPGVDLNRGAAILDLLGPPGS